MANSKNKKLLAFSLIELSIVVLIIGILIAGVTQGSRLIRQSKIKTAQNQTTNSPVNSITGLNLWLETTLDDSVISATNGNTPENGDLNSAWNDINNQDLIKNNATQGTTLNQPTYVLNGINGLPTLNFNGTSNLLNVGSGIISGPEFTVITVLKRSASTSSAILGPTSTSGVSLGYGGGSTVAIVFNSNGGSGSSIATYTVPAYSTPSPVIMSFTENSSSTSTFYLNGAIQGPSVIGMPYARPASYTVGRSFTYGYFQGNLAEMIIFNRVLKASERANIENYLAIKWGITCCS